jgi:hypothetical protein
VAFWIVLLPSPAHAQTQTCSDCDCYQIPMPTRCEGCCGIASGNISQVTDSTLVLAEGQFTGGAGGAKKAFQLKPSTKKNATLKEGAAATVYYRKEGDVAERIDMVEALKGLLVPGNGVTQPLPSLCDRFEPIPPDTLRVDMGNNVILAHVPELHLLNVAGRELLDVRRTSNGIAVNARTFSEDGKIIAEIIDNRFYVNPNNFFRVERPDQNSLIVFDLHDRKVVDVRYVNLYTVSIRGIFQIPGGPSLTVAEDGLSFDGIHSANTCGSVSAPNMTFFKF